MVQYQSKPRQLHMPELKSVNRISNIPIVETSFNIAGQLYNKIKSSNNLIYWTFDQAETSFFTVLDTASPAVFLLEAPLQTIDNLLCRSLDMVEQRVPSINLPPQMIYSNTKQYVSNVGSRIVKPVLRRADSVKQIGNSVLASKYTAFAADKLDGALNVADMYVDKYLPTDASDFQKDDTTNAVDGPAGKAMQTFQHVRMTSRKLKRGLTRRTLAEAKALKEQSAEAIHVLLYVAELVVTDPKLAFQKGKELWSSLSKDEPENQARPENLEQLIVMLTRESARRIVHLINFTSAGVSKLPHRMSRSVMQVTQKLMQLVDSLLKTLHLDGVQRALIDRAKGGVHSVGSILRYLNAYATDLLEHLSMILASQEESKSDAQKTQQPVAIKGHTYQFHNSVRDTLHPPVSPKPQLRATHRHVNNVANGVDSTS